MPWPWKHRRIQECFERTFITKDLTCDWSVFKVGGTASGLSTTPILHGLSSSGTTLAKPPLPLSTLISFPIWSFIFVWWICVFPTFGRVFLNLFVPFVLTSFALAMCTQQHVQQPEISRLRFQSQGLAVPWLNNTHKSPGKNCSNDDAQFPKAC